MPDSGPAIKLSHLLGRKLRANEVYDAFGVPKSTYYDLLAKGTLTTADRLIHAAKFLGLNPADLLVHFNHLRIEDVISSARKAMQAAEEAAERVKGACRLAPDKLGEGP